MGDVGDDPDGPSPELLYKPTAIAVDDHKNIYVMDSGNYRVAVFSKDGVFLREFGGAGQGPGEFASATFASLATSSGRIARLAQSNQQIQLFSVDGEFQVAVSSEVPIGSVALTSSALYAYSLEEGGRSARIRVYSLDGELSQVIGDDLVTQSRNAHELYALNSSSVAATDEGAVGQVYLHWPLLRMHDAGGSGRDYWLDFGWLEDGDLKRRVQRPHSLLSDPDVHMLHDEMRPIVSYDLEYVASSAQWLTLLYYGVVQVLTHEGEPVETMKLELPASYGDTYLFNEIAVDPSGELLCALENFEGRVFCFDLNDASAQQS